MDRPVTFALIGLGGISQSQHLPNLNRADGIQLQTVCDLRSELIDATRTKYQIPHGVTDVQQVLADPEIDAVLIATRPDTHVELTLAALQAGKHVYVEKPLAESTEQCQKVVAAQQAAGKLVAVGFNRRMAPACCKAKEILNAHGGPRNIHYRITDAYHIWGADFPPGSRVLHELGHVFDLLRFITDAEVTSVYCLAARPDDECIVLQFASGCVASIMSSGYVEYDMPKESFEIVMERGALTVNEYVELRTFGLPDEPTRICFAGHTHPDHDVTHRALFEAGNLNAMYDIRRRYWNLYRELNQPDESASHDPRRRKAMEAELARLPLINYMMDKGWLGALEHFARAIAGDIPLQLADAAAGLRVAQITDAVIKSRELHRPVEIPIILSTSRAPSASMAPNSVCHPVSIC